MSKRTPATGFKNAADNNLRHDGKVSMASICCDLKTNSTLKKTCSLTFSILGVLVLSGCASVGSFGGLTSAPAVDRSLVTASTGTAVEEQLDQAMPGALRNNSSALRNNIATTTPSVPYMPPGNVGGSIIAVPLAIASVSSSQLPPPVPNSSNFVPGVPQLARPQSTFVGSQQAMPAQTQTAISPARVTQPFQDSSVPQIASGGSAPTLSVVPNDGYKHTVESGESLYAIARRYNVKTDDIVRVNGLSSADQIFVGQKIIIPGREDLLGATPVATPSAPAATPDEPVRVATIAPVITAPSQTAPAQPAAQANGFRWPVNGRVIVDFEQSRRTGINIEAPEGAAVRAAEDGTVIYVGDGIEGFGNLVLVRHANGYVSAYAHLKGFSIANDTQVRRGDQIGTVGMTGSVNRPQLHFELRQGATPVDPMPLLAT
ncbi:MAG: M23 family metallopeptidase [Devosiaceae bacterium]|nr:M23 family metallopeptidase [Devosiaceae bacterium]